MSIDTLEKVRSLDSNKLSFHRATAYRRGQEIASSQNRAGEHAEMVLLNSYAMRKHRRERIEVYVERLSTNGHNMSRPCKTCSHFIKTFWPNVTVYYTNDIGIWTKDIDLDTNHICLADRMHTFNQRHLRHLPAPPKKGCIACI